MREAWHQFAPGGFDKLSLSELEGWLLPLLEPQDAPDLAASRSTANLAWLSGDQISFME